MARDNAPFYGIGVPRRRLYSSDEMTKNKASAHNMYSWYDVLVDDDNNDEHDDDGEEEAVIEKKDPHDNRAAVASSSLDASAIPFDNHGNNNNNYHNDDKHGTESNKDVNDEGEDFLFLKPEHFIDCWEGDYYVQDEFVEEGLSSLDMEGFVEASSNENRLCFYSGDGEMRNYVEPPLNNTQIRQRIPLPITDKYGNPINVFKASGTKQGDVDHKTTTKNKPRLPPTITDKWGNPLLLEIGKMSEDNNKNNDDIDEYWYYKKPSLPVITDKEGNIIQIITKRRQEEEAIVDDDHRTTNSTRVALNVTDKNGNRIELPKHNSKLVLEQDYSIVKRHVNNDNKIPLIIQDKYGNIIEFNKNKSTTKVQPLCFEDMEQHSKTSPIPTITDKNGIPVFFPRRSSTAPLAYR